MLGTDPGGVVAALESAFAARERGEPGPEVRRPIYRASVGRWRNYERHFEPLKAALHAVRSTQ